MAAERIANDAYYTEAPLARAICGRLHPLLVMGDAPRILEPSAGNGVFCREARKVWGAAAHITAVEPFPAAPLWLTHVGDHDDLNKVRVMSIEHYCATHAATFDLTIGNPPFLYAEEHLALVRPISTYVAFLLRLGFLASQGRAERVYKEPGLRYLMPIAERPSFTGGGTDKYDYAVYVWQKDYPGLAQVLPHLWVGA